MESANQFIGDNRFEFFDFSYIKEGKVTGGKGQKEWAGKLWKTGCYPVLNLNLKNFRQYLSNGLTLLCSMSSELLKNWQKKSGERQKLYKQYLHRADKNKVLRQLPDLHEEAFSKVDCLQCANCCKNYSPRFKTTDVKRIAKLLQMKEGVFIDRYLTV